MPEWLVSYAEAFQQWLFAFAPSFAKGLGVFLLGVVASKAVKYAFDKTARRVRIDAVLWEYLGTVLRTVALIVFLIAALKVMGFPVNSLLATFGISGLIIGLGARQSMANYFAGITMLAAKPFKKGDLIEFGPPPQIGVVREVKMTCTKLDTVDNVRITVPNAVIWRNKVLNFSVHKARAIRIPLAVPYDVDVDWVEDIALGVLHRHDAVLNDPEPVFTVSDVTPTDVRAALTAWSSVGKMNIFGDVIAEMRKDFEAAGLAVTVPAKEIDLKREE